MGGSPGLGTEKGRSEEMGRACPLRPAPDGRCYRRPQVRTGEVTLPAGPQSVLTGRIRLGASCRN